MSDVYASKTDVSKVVDIFKVLKLACDFYEQEKRTVTFSQDAEEEMFRRVNSMNAAVHNDQTKRYSSFHMGLNSKHQTKMYRYGTH